MRRDQWDIKQREVLAHLPGWTQANYSRLESGVIAPAFDQLLPIYRGLCLAGVQWTLSDREQFLGLARTRIKDKKTHWEHRSDADWAELRYQLANTDLLPDDQVAPAKKWVPPRPLLTETRHLVGREEWLSTVIHAVQDAPAKKLMVLQGPMGIGKSSELHRIASHFITAHHPVYKVIWLSLLPVERSGDPQAPLDVLLGTILAELGAPSPASVLPVLEERLTYALAQLERSPQPVVLLVDNAEGVLTDEGTLASCWEHFLAQFLRCHHQATILLATREWPGWSGRERLFVAELIVPQLTIEASVLLFQHLGLEHVPVQHLRAASERVGGIPLCLEWVAALAQDPILLDDWQGFDIDEETRGHVQDREAMTQRLLQLLEEPALLRGHLATRLAPLLNRIIEKRLSQEAKALLYLLAVATVPLGKPALRELGPRPKPLKELRDASLLVAYPHRVQLLPMVASAVLQQLTPEQVQEKEEHFIHALTCWLDEGTFHEREQGAVITELAVLLLRHQRLGDAAELLIRFGWMSFNLGNGSRLAHLAQEVLQQVDWHHTAELECVGLVLLKILVPFLGTSFDGKHYADFRHLRDALIAGNLVLEGAIEDYVTQLLMVDAMNDLRFEEAQTMLEAYSTRLDARGMSPTRQQSSVLQKRAMLLGRWCEYAEERGETQQARALREEAIALYRQCDLLLSSQEGTTPLNRHLRKKRLASYVNNLGYHLNRTGQYEEALQAVERALALQEQGYAYVGALAASYGEKSQILMALGRFQEAVQFDEKALAEIQRCADAGDALSQEEIWIYRVNRGRLYLRLGRVDEAEQLLQDALPHIHARRRMYRMFAKEALEEIEQWRRQTTASKHRLDWRWVERYRTLASYDSYWWLTWAGPFAEEEQHQWERLFSSPRDDAAREQLGALLKQSRERELAAALAEQREPRLHYPAIEIEEVRRRIKGLLQLATEISQKEPNAIVRRLYHGAIEEEVDVLRLIEATYAGNTEQFWECNLRVLPVPTVEEMEYTFSRLRYILREGLKRPETAEVSQRLDEFLRTRLNVVFDMDSYEDDIPERQEAASQLPRTVSAQAARRFFEAALRESGFDSWQVVIDPNASGMRVEQGLRRLFLPEQRFSLEKIRDLFSHELLGHVARCAAGERSPLGLLGIHTKHSLPTEEGIALYHEREVAELHGREFDDAGVWRGALVTGLASGVVTPPLTFLSLFTFLESFSLLTRLLKKPDADRQKVQQQARAFALSVCLRTYRGVPDLERAGVCFLQDAVYLRGLRMIEQAVAQDGTVLDRLAAGVVALELLPDLQELGITSSPLPLRRLAYDPDLDSYIVSFETGEEAEKRA
ncbi:MAG: tetratricopeptide repeat protein [Ktedonobacteraceae bacterium]